MLYHRNRMRVIAGTYRSRQLRAPRGSATRPTSDRLRETLFNVLAKRMEGAVFADLYAGSGAVGIEALSRGASHVFFVDNAPGAVAIIRANLAALNIESGYSIEVGDVSAVLRASPKQQVWDLVFIDPPYGDANAYVSTLGALGRLGTSLLAPDSMVIAEHHHKQPLEISYGPLARARVLKQGEAALSFYQIAG